MNALGHLLQSQGKADKAEPMMRKVVTGSRRSLGDLHPITLKSKNTLGILLQSQGKLKESESLLRDSLELRRRTLGNNHPDTRESIHDLAKLLKVRLARKEGIVPEEIPLL